MSITYVKYFNIRSEFVLTEEWCLNYRDYSLGKKGLCSQKKT